MPNSNDVKEIIQFTPKKKVVMRDLCAAQSMPSTDLVFRYGLAFLFKLVLASFSPLMFFTHTIPETLL